MPRINIPVSIEDAKSSLNGLGSLLQAKEWERAAIVYAFTGPNGPTRPRTLSLRAFADLGIVGLTNKDTVAEYRKAWESAMEDGAPAAAPGDVITVPNLPWPPGFIKHGRGSHATTEEVEAGIAKAIKDNPEKIVKALVTEARGALVNTIAEMPAVGDEVTVATAAVRASRAPARSGPVLKTDHVLITVINALNEFWLREVQAGPARLTFQQVVETVIENPGSPTLRSHSVPTAHLGSELLDALAKHIGKSEDIRDGKTLSTTGVALVGKGVV